MSKRNYDNLSNEELEDLLDGDMLSEEDAEHIESILKHRDYPQPTSPIHEEREDES